MATNVTNFLSLPDEILLEIYKFLLNSHVLYSFYGINSRLNRSIHEYCGHVSLTDITFDQSKFLCSFVLSNIGYKIRTLLLNNCRSVLVGKMFSQYFSHRMPEIFPNLEKIVLTCFTADELETFLKAINNMNYLHQIEVHDVLTNEPSLFQCIISANQNRFVTIKLKAGYSDLPTSICPNINDLTISIRTIDKLLDLAPLIPNVHTLNVKVSEKIALEEISFEQLTTFNNLKRLSLRCYNRFWTSNEIQSLLKSVPFVQELSLQLSSYDTRFVGSNQNIIGLLPNHLQRFDFLLRYFYETIEEIDQQALLKSRFPMICLINEELERATIHTIPCRINLFNISSSMGKQMSTYEDYLNVRRFYDCNDMTLSSSFPIISKLHRVKEIAIQSYEAFPVKLSTPPQLMSLPTFHSLKCLWLLDSSREFYSLKALLRSAPNLSELFISFDNLLPIFNDIETCELLGNRITHLLILRIAPAAPTVLALEHIPTLVQVFRSLRHLQIDVTDGPSIELVVRSILDAFRDRTPLISLVVEGQSSSDELKMNTRQWLIDNTHMKIDGKFDAEFKPQTSRFLLWM